MCQALWGGSSAVSEGAHQRPATPIRSRFWSKSPLWPIPVRMKIKSKTRKLPSPLKNNSKIVFIMVMFLKVSCSFSRCAFLVCSKTTFKSPDYYAAISDEKSKIDSVHGIFWLFPDPVIFCILQLKVLSRHILTQIEGTKNSWNFAFLSELSNTDFPSIWRLYLTEKKLKNSDFERVCHFRLKN